MDEIARWRRRLLPFMQGTLALLAAYFVVSSEMRFQAMQRVLTEHHSPASVANRAWGDSTVMAGEMGVRVALEEETLDRRYEQANTLVLSRAWTRYMAFVTGMVLAMVGAAFVLGRLNEQSKLTSELPGKAALSLESSSPGLFLALFGTVLMGLAVASGIDVQVTDSPVYVLPRASAEQPAAGGQPRVLPRRGSTADDSIVNAFDPRDSSRNKPRRP